MIIKWNNVLTLSSRSFVCGYYRNRLASQLGLWSDGVREDGSIISALKPMFSKEWEGSKLDTLSVLPLRS